MDIPPSPLLDHLNTPQREAVAWQDGAVMVLAGAGSGKTRVLTRRLAYLLQERGMAPERILAVTFTNKAAREMRERVAELLNIGDTIGRRLWIGTFHGMGARMLRQHAEALGFNPDFTILDSDEQTRLIKKLAAQMGFEHAYWTPKRLAGSFSRWKDDGKGPDDIGTDEVRYTADLVAVARFFTLYQAALRRLNAMDFGDLLSNCLTLWQKHPEVLDGYRDRFLHVLVDEYQDTNKVQYEWMKGLASGHGNLCVVGDDDQSIYSWRGARLDNILRFEEDFPHAQVIRLEQNYRSTGNILRAASQLISHNAGRMGKRLWTEGETGAQLQHFTAEDGADEARFAASEIALLCKDRQFGKVAILVRTSHQTRALEEALNRRDLPYRVVGGLRFMDRAEIRDAVAYLRLAYLSRDDIAFERVFNVPSRKLGPSALRTIQETANHHHTALLEGARQVVADKLLGPAACQRLGDFIQAIDAGRTLSASVPANDVLAQLLTQSGYYDALAKTERGEDKRENLQELHAFLAQTRDLVAFLEQAALDSDPPRPGQPADDNRVTVSTLHAAKGLEFPIVFLVGLEEGLLPHALALDSNAGLEEERRLLYVGMTRAREKLYLCHARRRMVFNRFEPAMASRFLKEIPSDTVETKGLKLSVRRPFGRR